MLEISIIIPCYNAEMYVKRCLDSLVMQSIDCSLFEIICIDDGSSDNTYGELLKYKEEHACLNIKLFRLKDNHGPSFARNIGIKNAKGKFLNFLDIDDVQTVDTYKKLLEPLKRKEYQVIIGKHIRADIDSSCVYNSLENRKDQEYYFDSIDGFTWHKYDNVGNNGDFFTLGATLVDRELVIENNILFPEEFIINEDDYWFSLLQLYVQKVYIVDWVVHIYVISENSLMTSADNPRLMERVELYEALYKEYRDRGVISCLYQELLNYFLRRYVLSSFYVFTQRMKEIPNIEKFNHILNFYNEKFPDWLELYDRSTLMIDEVTACEFLEKIYTDDREFTYDNIKIIKEIYANNN